MKNSISKKLSLAFAGAALSLGISFSAIAAVPAGTLEGADNSSVYGWVWDSDSYGHVIPVEISVYPADSSEVLKTATVKANHYQEKLQESIGDGYHGFTYAVDWNQFDDEDFRVTAYAVTETERVFLGELTYNKGSDQFTPNSVEEASSEISAPQKSRENKADVQGPGEASVSMQAPEQAAVSSQAPKQTAVSTQAPEQTSASQQSAAGLPVSTQAPGQAVSSLEDIDGKAASSQAPGQIPASLQAVSGTLASAKASKQAAAPRQEVNSVQAADSAQTDKENNASEAPAGVFAASSENSSTSSAIPLRSREIGPGVTPKKEAQPQKLPVSLGMFTVTGYCGCEICCPSSTSKLTYSETEPQPNHTVSADIDVFPIGTRLMIDGIIYTVEDIGSNVTENKIDIFYSTHEEALAHGTTMEEVFAVAE